MKMEELKKETQLKPSNRFLLFMFMFIAAVIIGFMLILSLWEVIPISIIIDWILTIATG